MVPGLPLKMLKGMVGRPTERAKRERGRNAGMGAYCTEEYLGGEHKK